MNKIELKSKFQRGDKPTEEDYINFIDHTFNENDGDGTKFLSDNGLYKDIDKTDVGLGNVDNTADTDKIVSHASTVTMNANLTGVITSIGNSTSIASKTGTSDKIVTDNSPTLITPNIGVATATSVNGMHLTESASGFTVAGGTVSEKTLMVVNTLTLSGTDSSTLNIGNGGTLGTSAFTNVVENTTLGLNLYTLANTSAISFLRINANNTVSTLDASTFRTAIGAGTSSTTGTVTNTSVVTANGISGTVATSTTTPAITLSLGAITPTSVNSIMLSGSATPTLSVTGTTSVSGTNTGDNAVNSNYSGLVTNATHTGDATGSTALTVKGINNVILSTLATGILKNTTTTGVPSIAIASDFPVLNQNTTGTASKATNIVGGNNTTLLGTIPYQSNTDTTTLLAPNTSTTIKFLSQTGTGTNGAVPTWNTSTGTGSVVLSTSPTLTTPSIGVATGTSFNSITGLASVAPVAPAVTAVVGISTLTARQDHVHPTNFTATATDIKMDGVQSVGTLTTFPRADHVHPVDTSRAAVAQTMYIGTTSVAINRASASLDLTGITSISGYSSAVTLTADNTTNATNYPLFANAATGNLSPRTDTGFTYNPSTGTLTASKFVGEVNVSSIIKGISNISTSSTLASEYIIFASGEIALTLPPASISTGREYVIKKVDMVGTSILIDGNGTDSIDNKPTRVLSEFNEAVTLICDGTNWKIINTYRDSDQYTF